MPIPPTSPHRLRSFLLVSLAFGLAASSSALLLWAGVLPTRLRSGEECPRPPPAAACAECSECPQTAPSALTLRAPEPEPEPVTSYRVCDANGGAPYVTPLALSGGAIALGIHCGQSVHVIAFDQGEPRRILRIDGPNLADQLEAQPAALVAADIDGDDRTDLLIGTRVRDAQASPRGGGLYFVRSAQRGGFEDARVLAPLPVASLAVGRFEPSAGMDMAIVQLEDARLTRQSELLLLRGGPAPVKTWAAPAGLGAVRVAAFDLDLDGRDEIALSGPASAPELLYLDEVGALRERISLELPAVHDLLTADMDGDGALDLLFVGEQTSLLRATREPERSVQELAATPSWSNLQVIDWNGDARPDLIGQHEQALWGLIQTGPLVFEARELAQLPDSETAMQAVWTVSPPDAKERVMVMVSTFTRENSEVEVQRLSTTGAVLRGTRSLPLQDAPLSQHMRLR